MAHFEMPRSQFGGHSLGGRLAATINAVFAWNDARATRKSLSVLTDRELDDIGLVRADIDMIATK
ncbi:MAG: DUF1127 domain-containing protein [Pseudomonadota bacterium]